AEVGSANEVSNHARTAGENGSSATPAKVLPACDSQISGGFSSRLGWFRPSRILVRPYQRALAGLAVLATLTVTGVVHSPFVNAASLENGGPRTISNLAYGTRADQRLDLVLPPASKFLGPRPLIVWLHAGGWEYGSRKDPAPLPRYEVTRGYAMASVDYGLSPTYHFPTPVHDVKLAILWLKAHAAQYGLDPTNAFRAGYPSA